MQILENTLGKLGLAALFIGVILLAHYLLYALGRAWARRTPWGLDDSVLKHTRVPTGLLAVLLAFKFLLPSLDLSAQGAALASKSLTLTMIAGFAWLAVSLTSVLQDLADRRFDINAADNLMARQVHTQLRIIRRLMLWLVVLVAGAMMLMSFPAVRAVGASLLASAGIVGLILGMAARPALSNLIAGVQIALAQPIRLDDVVVVEGEWGKIEEIATTFVVVRIWDERRLVLPISYFIEKPFQNWTRKTADILGTVVLYTDYDVPVQILREELTRLVKESGLWDKRVCGLQVTDATPDTLKLRALISASDASKAWDLRCLVREKMVEFIRKEYPQSLPKTRVVLDSKQG